MLKQPPAGRSALWAIAVRATTLLGCTLLWTCDQPSMDDTGPVYAKVRLMGVPSGTQELRVTVTLNDQPHRKSPYTIPNAPNEFWVELDRGSSGKLSIGVEALSEKCTVASGLADKQIGSAQRFELDIFLAQLPVKTCTLTVIKNGEGRVTTEPAGVDCGQKCSYSYSFGTKITLNASPAIGMNPGVWSNACSGTGPCEVTITGPVTVGVDFAPKICTAAGWCWENPTPQGNDLKSLWIASDKTAFAVGAHGTALRWNGVTWVSMPTPIKKDLNGVWGSGLNDIWAVGSDGTILRWNGISWAPQNSGVTAHLNAIWGSRADDIWAVGQDGTATHYDGIRWTKFDSKTTEPLSAVWGASANDIWAVGSKLFGGSVITHFDGMSWMALPVNTFPDGLKSVWGSGSSDVWAAGGKTILHWQGSTWAPEPTPMLQTNGAFTGVWGTSATNIWISNATGPMLRWRGSKWVVSGQRETSNFNAVSGSQENDIWAVGNKGLALHGNEAAWSVIGRVNAELARGWVASPSEGWAIGAYPDDRTIYRWNGVSWENAFTAESTLLDIWGSAPDDVWAVGSIILHWDGSSWQVAQRGLSSALRAVHGTGSKDVWAVGGDGLSQRWNGSSWSNNPKTTDPVLGGYVQFDSVYTNGQDTWALGASTIFRWTGSGWMSQKRTAGITLNSISGKGGDIFVVGGTDKAAILKWAGTDWTDVSPPNALSLSKVLVTQAADAWAVGDGGTVLHWDGMSWLVSESGTNRPLRSVFGSGPNNLFIAGAQNAILRNAR